MNSEVIYLISQDAIVQMTPMLQLLFVAQD